MLAAQERRKKLDPKDSAARKRKIEEISENICERCWQEQSGESVGCCTCSEMEEDKVRVWLRSELEMKFD